MLLIKTKETNCCIYDRYFIDITYLNIQFEVCMDAYTDKTLGIAKLKIAYDTAQDNTK